MVPRCKLQALGQEEEAVFEAERFLWVFPQSLHCKENLRVDVWAQAAQAQPLRSSTLDYIAILSPTSLSQLTQVLRLGPVGLLLWCRPWTYTKE